MDWRDRRLICELYLHQEAVVRLGGEQTDPCEVGRGVRQGCLLSPLLFSIYVERMMMEAMDGSKQGIKVGGQLVRDVRFADDQAMLDETESGLQIVMDRLSHTAEDYGMKINVKKTKVMKISKKVGGIVNKGWWNC